MMSIVKYIINNCTLIKFQLQWYKVLSSRTNDIMITNQGLHLSFPLPTSSQNVSTV